MKKLILKKGKEVSVKRRHPWIFSGAIASNPDNAIAGDWVEVLDSQNNFLGCGQFEEGSIAIKLLDYNNINPDVAYWQQKIAYALDLRRNFGLPSAETNAWRLIHGEGDGLPGLIVDVYGSVAVMQAHSTGMHQSRHLIAEALIALLGDALKHIYYKSENTLPGKLRNTVQNEYLLGGGNGTQDILEGGITYSADWEKGQKTGFFTDQRNNRSLLRNYAKGTKVLNLFSYTGGFSIAALHGGADEVISVDVSEKALELARQLIEKNDDWQHKHLAVKEDAFAFLEKSTQQYDIIILDPPAFAKHQSARHNAVKGYQRLNQLAMKQVVKGGLLFTFSCSQAIDRKLFYDTIASAAILAGRPMRVIHHLSQAEDHPVSIYHPEGEYLKGLVLEIG
ncbi:MAG: class I SAM-dependent rRNA methyltransferase [Cyclobacteriaceae bacterium]|nr:class I SAM-dependent rRNA methyltransferase [Cyclobacteriaceae bacterium]